jgi:hypothetical protein
LNLDCLTVPAMTPLTLFLEAIKTRVIFYSFFIPCFKYFMSNVLCLQTWLRYVVLPLFPSLLAYLRFPLEFAFPQKIRMDSD